MRLGPQQHEAHPGDHEHHRRHDVERLLDQQRPMHRVARLSAAQRCGAPATAIQGIVTRWKNRPRLAEEEAEALRQEVAERSLLAGTHLAPLHFFAGAVFGGAERLGQTLRGAARPERLGLRGVRRPAVQEQDLEARRRRGPTAGRSARHRSPPRAAAWRGALRPRRRSTTRLLSPMAPRSRIRARALSYSTSIVSLSATGRAKPARCSRPAASRRSANGETRGLRPPSISLSAAASAWRSCHSVPPPSMAPRNSPSGFRMRPIWISVPGRSLTQCSAMALSTRSKRAARRAALPRRRPRRARARLAREAQAEIGAHQALHDGARPPAPWRLRRRDSRDRAPERSRAARRRAARPGASAISRLRNAWSPQRRAARSRRRRKAARSNTSRGSVGHGLYVGRKRADGRAACPFGNAIACLNRAMRLGGYGVRRRGRRLLDAVLPPLCLGCNEIVAEPGALCATCWPGFSFIAAPHVRALRRALRRRYRRDRAMRRLPAPAAALSPGARGAGLRRRGAGAWCCRSSTAIAPTWPRACGRWMARAGHELLAEADLVAPVPLHWRRLFTRRYNQALLLARSVARPSGRPAGRPTCCIARAGPVRRPDSRPRSGARTSARLRGQCALGRPGEGQGGAAGRRRADHRRHRRGLRPRPAACRSPAR